MRLVDLTFYTNDEYADTAALLEAQQASLFYIDAIKNKITIDVVKHVSAGTVTTEKDRFHFFISKNERGYISSETLRFLKKIKPDIVIVHGLSFPLHVIRLKMIFGNNIKIIAWHHAEHPAGWPKKILYRAADKCINKYLFTSQENAAEWIAKGIIAGKNKIAELPPTLTIFQRENKTEAKQKLQMSEGPHYLWVGRLDPVKDPVTVLRSFEKFVATMPAAKLHMIYQGGTLLTFVENMINENAVLKNNILLHGYVPNKMLATWYSAADFLVSASVSEAGSVTILEAMACGCIPLVTAIPASLKVTDQGRYGFQYAIGDVDGLVKALIRSTETDREMLADQVHSHFKKEFSVEAVVEKLLAVCGSIIHK